MEKEKRKRQGNLLENLFIVVLAFYPLRHIAWGLDLWDTGYNYANFQYMGTRHMDPMWLFSTYLANVTGNFLTGLPNGDSLRGMNLYTGLFVSGLALAGYFFCTRKLRMPRGIVFLGEMTAVSLCWCPTAVLYNYLTYALFLASVILLYLGLLGEKRGYMVLAGALLGTNVLVRFSNLPEMAMIAAVWAYDFILWREESRKEVSPGTERGGKKKAGKKEGYWHRTLRHTLWCLAGYVAALVFLLSLIQIKYGIDEYITGIGRLFAMTENAQDYKASSMIMGILRHYVENLYWAARIAVIAAGGMALFAGAGWLEALLAGTAGKDKPKGGGTAGKGGGTFRDEAAGRGVPALRLGVRILWTGVCAAMIWWLYKRGFCSLLFYSYDPIWRPGPLFLMLTMLIGVIRIFHRNSSREEKLISGLVILTVLVTPMGSNNGILPSLNNLFLAAPYTLWESWRFLRLGERKIKGGILLSAFPLKGILTAFLALCLFQFGAFGAGFAFAEATGIRNATDYVYNNPVLKNVKMSPEKAEWMRSLSEYVMDEELQGREVILYGWIPALSYYLQMPPAFNSWSDLDSYRFEVMEEALGALEERMRKNSAERPVIILEDEYALRAAAYMGDPEAAGSAEKGQTEAEQKWDILLDFMRRFGYTKGFRNEKFAVYR